MSLITSRGGTTWKCLTKSNNGLVHQPTLVSAQQHQQSLLKFLVQAICHSCHKDLAQSKMFLRCSVHQGHTGLWVLLLSGFFGESGIENKMKKGRKDLPFFYFLRPKYLGTLASFLASHFLYQANNHFICNQCFSCVHYFF